jgi:hypothetical protein
VGIGLHRTKIINGDDLNVGPVMFQNGPQDEPSNPAESIDGNFDRHGLPLC